MKSDQIRDPDRLFNNIAEKIATKPKEIGIELGLAISVLTNELETGEMRMKTGSKQALKMLELWQKSTNEDDLTYSVLAAALKKHGFVDCADKYCNSSTGNPMNIFFVHVLMV